MLLDTFSPLCSLFLQSDVVLLLFRVLLCVWFACAGRSLTCDIFTAIVTDPKLPLNLFWMKRRDQQNTEAPQSVLDTVQHMPTNVACLVRISIRVLFMVYQEKSYLA